MQSLLEENENLPQVLANLREAVHSRLGNRFSYCAVSDKVAVALFGPNSPSNPSHASRMNATSGLSLPPGVDSRFAWGGCPSLTVAQALTAPPDVLALAQFWKTCTDRINLVVTLMVTVWLLFMVPIAQVRVRVALLKEHLPCVVVDDTYFTGLGSGSVATTLKTCFPPHPVTLIVNTIGLPPGPA